MPYETNAEVVICVVVSTNAVLVIPKTTPTITLIITGAKKASHLFNAPLVTTDIALQKR